MLRAAVRPENGCRKIRGEQATHACVVLTYRIDPACTPGLGGGPRPVSYMETRRTRAAHTSRNVILGGSDQVFSHAGRRREGSS